MHSKAASTPPIEKEVPAPTPKKKRHWFFFGKQDDEDSIVVQKSGAEAQKDLVPAPGGGGVRWQYLTPAVRQAIDEQNRASLAQGRPTVARSRPAIKTRASTFGTCAAAAT